MRTKGFQFALKHKFKIIDTPTNTISIAMKIGNIETTDEDLTELGAILYGKRVMGHRIVA